jgi:hypothetical protein
MIRYSSRAPQWLARTLGFAALTALSTACASSARYSATPIHHVDAAPAPSVSTSNTTSSTSTRSEGTVRTSRYTVAQPEFSKFAVANAHDIVAKLRPEFLLRSPRAVSVGSFAGPIVYVDSHRFGDISALTMIPAGSVVDITYVTPVDALLRFGPSDGAGVIVVRTRR